MEFYGMTVLDIAPDTISIPYLHFKKLDAIA